MKMEKYFQFLSVISLTVFLYSTFILVCDDYKTTRSATVCFESIADLKNCTKRPFRFFVIDSIRQKSLSSRILRSITAPISSSCETPMRCFRIEDIVFITQILTGTLSLVWTTAPLLLF
ncbi:hypothetical protein ACOME3_007352 [Neoechinorhynchus agilis]